MTSFKFIHARIPNLTRSKAAAVDRFTAHIGSKVFIAEALGWEKVPPSSSLGIIFAILDSRVVVSLWKTSTPNVSPVAVTHQRLPPP